MDRREDMRPLKRQKVTSTEIKYDNLYHGHNKGEDGTNSFRTSRNNRFNFKEQDKREFQDDEDIENEMESTKVFTDFKDLSDVLELVLNEVDVVHEKPSDVSESKKKKARKVKLQLDYGEDQIDGDDLDSNADLEMKFAKVESKMKFQRGRIAKRTEKADSIYKDFVKEDVTTIPRIANLPFIPGDYNSNFMPKDLANAPLNRHTASSLLQSKFAKSGTPPAKQSEKGPQQFARMTIPIEVNPLVKKRLNIR